ncbi:uncharacterized protein rassf11 [Gadus macrocephalus]|uniref:uncharacterized protein rassf11 n=1 Tax=Gadus macrocephalus TaxID=80720 RepID=UPI0028CB83FD|nr:uncharacterized protein rassf11 [Gadus macrocephalus]XP_059909546.1 uncharacterized protein rassf11 [Gadus macrocephalus]
MEVKVHVDGVPRVVCGVTDSTTCQEVVIALAQALSRPGRYTLQEKFKDFERCVAPGERLLEALHKYGEHGKEVQLTLLLNHRPPLLWDPAPGGRPPDPRDPPAPPLRRRRPDPRSGTRKGGSPLASSAHRQSLPVLSRLRQEEEEEGPLEEVKRPKRKSLTLMDAWGWLGSLGRGRLHYCVSDPEGNKMTGKEGTGNLPEGSVCYVPVASGSVGSQEASGQEGFLSRVRRRKRQSRERRASCCGTAENGPDEPRFRKSFLGAKHQTLGAKHQNPGAKDQTPGAKDQTLGAKDQTLGGKDQTLGAKDQTPGAKDQTPGAKDQTLGAKDQTLGAKDQTPGAKDQTLGAKDQNPGAKDETLVAKDQTLGAKDQNLTSKDQTLGRASRAEEEKIKLREQITSQGSRLRDLDLQLSSVDRQIQELEGQQTEGPARPDSRRSSQEQEEEREEVLFWEQQLQAELGFEGDIQTQFLELREKARQCKAELEEYRRRMQRLAFTAGATPPVQKTVGEGEDRGTRGKGVTEIGLAVETSEASGGGDTGRKETPSQPHAPVPPEQIKERRLTGPTELGEWWKRWSETQSKAAAPPAPVHRSELTIYLGSAKV